MPNPALAWPLTHPNLRRFFVHLDGSKRGFNLVRKCTVTLFIIIGSSNGSPYRESPNAYPAVGSLVSLESKIIRCYSTYNFKASEYKKVDYSNLLADIWKNCRYNKLLSVCLARLYMKMELLKKPIFYWMRKIYFRYLTCSCGYLPSEIIRNLQTSLLRRTVRLKSLYMVLILNFYKHLPLLQRLLGLNQVRLPVYSIWIQSMLMREICS